MLIGKEALTIRVDKLAGGKNCHLIAEQFDTGLSGTMATGYKKSVAGSLVGDADFIDGIGSIDFDLVDGRGYLYSSFFAGKPASDGYVANVYQIDFDSKFLSGRYYLVPEVTFTEDSNGAILSVIYPGDYYILVEDIPDEIIVKGKEGNVLGRHKINYPQEMFSIYADTGVYTYDFYKQGVIVPSSYILVASRTIAKTKIVLNASERYDFSFVLQDVVEGKGGGKHLIFCASNRSLFREAA